MTREFFTTLTGTKAHLRDDSVNRYATLCGREIAGRADQAQIDRQPHLRCGHCDRIARRAHQAAYQARKVAEYGCCEQATFIPCVCLYAFTCPVHGDRHVGTHD